MTATALNLLYFSYITYSRKRNRESRGRARCPGPEATRGRVETRTGLRDAWARGRQGTDHGRGTARGPHGKYEISAALLALIVTSCICSMSALHRDYTASGRALPCWRGYNAEWGGTISWPTASLACPLREAMGQSPRRVQSEPQPGTEILSASIRPILSDTLSAPCPVPSTTDCAAGRAQKDGRRR